MILHYYIEKYPDYLLSCKLASFSFLFFQLVYTFHCQLCNTPYHSSSFRCFSLTQYRPFCIFRHSWSSFHFDKTSGLYPLWNMASLNLNKKTCIFYILDRSIYHKEGINVIGSFENHELPLFLQIIVALDPCRPSCLHFPLPAL